MTKIFCYIFLYFYCDEVPPPPPLSLPFMYIKSFKKMAWIDFEQRTSKDFSQKLLNSPFSQSTFASRNSEARDAK